MGLTIAEGLFDLEALYAFLDEENDRECALLEVRSRLIVMCNSHLIDPSSELMRTVSRAIILAYEEQLAKMIGAPVASSLQPPLEAPRREVTPASRVALKHTQEADPHDDPTA